MITIHEMLIFLSEISLKKLSNHVLKHLQLEHGLCVLNMAPNILFT